MSARSLVGEGGTVWTITPGMVELGPEQARRNADFARAATADEGMQLCIVGHTNRAALQRRRREPDPGVREPRGGGPARDGDRRRRATWCCTRTTCPTTTRDSEWPTTERLSHVISKATVVFGGPSAEHDISILTGLQAERVLAGAGVTVQCVYWSRNDQWYLVPAQPRGPRLHRAATASRPASKRLELRIGAKKGSGFYLEGGLGGGKLLETGPVLNCFHGGARRGRRLAGAVRAARRCKATGGTVAAAALGMDKLAFGGVMEAAGVPCLKRTLLSVGRAAAVRRPLHRQAAVRRLLDRHRGGRGLGDRGRAADHVAGPARGRGRRAEPAGAVRPQRLGPHRADPGRLRDREAAAPRRRRDLLLRREVPPPRGALRRAARVPRRHLARAARHDPVPGRPRGRADRADRHRCGSTSSPTAPRSSSTRSTRSPAPWRSTCGRTPRPPTCSSPRSRRPSRPVPRATGNYEVGVALRAAGGIAGKLAGAAAAALTLSGRNSLVPGDVAAQLQAVASSGGSRPNSRPVRGPG